MAVADLTRSLLDFVRGIGIEVIAAPLSEDTVLPGLDIKGGALVVDEARLAHPGDILHEAGHIAVMDPEKREDAGFASSAGDEMAAIAWSYAAARHLGVPAEAVFHPDGYKGDSASLIENFDAGRTFGVPLLQWYGMTVEPCFAAKRGVAPFPHMLRWMR
jgi:hypothetical protein